eukprot:4790941-Prymnesium_polylepis.1
MCARGALAARWLLRKTRCVAVLDSLAAAPSSALGFALARSPTVALPRVGTCAWLRVRVRRAHRGYVIRPPLPPVALKRYGSEAAELSLPTQHGHTTKLAAAAIDASMARSEASPQACSARPTQKGSSKCAMSPCHVRTLLRPDCLARASARSSERRFTSTIVTVHHGSSAASGRASGPEPPAKSTRCGVVASELLASITARATRLSICWALRSARFAVR